MLRLLTGKTKTMDAREFVDLLDNPQNITPKLLEDLSRVVKQYPYFSTGVLAYLKGLKDADDPRFSSFLPYAATHAQSGEWLYLFLNSSSDYFGEEIVSTATETVISENRSTEELAPESTSDTVLEEQNEVETSPEQDQALEHESLTAETELEVELQNEGMPQEEEAALIEDANVAPVLEPVAIAEPDVVEEEEILELIDDDIDESRLHEDPIFEILDQKLYTLDETAIALEMQNSLIDQFLTTNPRITPKGELPPVIEDISVKSLVDDGEIVTEMLAKIYAGQGLIAKAINVYEKLILKYPEKRAYFVAELEKLKESK